MLKRIKALHHVQSVENLVSIIPSRDLPPKLTVNSQTVCSALSAMDKDCATSPDRAVVRWLLLVVNFEHKVHEDFSGLALLTKVVQKLAAGEF